MKRRWTQEEANAWYDKQGWLRGCNFIGSDCCSRIDMWQSYGRKGHMETARRELKLCQDTGFNTIRMIVEFDVWLQERESFMSVLEEYISIAAEYGQRVMLCLAHEAVICREETYQPKKLGEQAYAMGYHQGRWPLSAEEKAKTPVHALERPETRDKYLEMVCEIVAKYANDERVICWNVYNEPSLSIGPERSVQLLDMLFETVRSCDPTQPLCSDICDNSRFDENGVPEHLSYKRSLELSDVISFHCYQPIDVMVPMLEKLQMHNRPILMTEWLNRIKHSGVRDLYPLFYLENVSCWAWGFVVGKTQTHEPWDAIWEAYDRNPSAAYDFTLWQHDLFRPNLRPYDPRELEIIKRYNTLAAQKMKL